MERTLRSKARVRLCNRESKWRNRRRQGIAGLLRSVHDLNDNVYDAAEDLIGVRNEVHRIRAKLNKLKSDLSDKKDNLQKATKELDKAVRDLQSPNSLHDLSVEESSALKIDLWMAEGDIVEAWNHIHDAEDDLNYEMLSNYIKEFNEQDSSNIEDGVRNMNAVALSNIASNNAIPMVKSMNGTIKVNRHKCCICLEAKIDCLLYKCGHACTCYSCTTVILADPEKRKCPVCRTPIKEVIKTYIPS